MQPSATPARDDVLDDLLSWSPDSSRPRGLSEPVQPVNVCVGEAAASQMKPEGPAEPLAIPTATLERLLPHQREGVEWLYTKHRRARACLLADEMGLGKTIQVCAFIGALYRMGKAKTCLIVAPPTLLPMWEGALLQWGGLKHPVVQIVRSDPRPARQAKWASLKSGIDRVYLTSYGILREDATAMSACMVDYCILDEAHAIKDAGTRTYRSALLITARHKVALTGTPLMNSFEDMWSIFRFLDGSIMNTSLADFKRSNRAILRGNERDASAGCRSEAQSLLAALQDSIRPFMLRREKKDLSVVESTKTDRVLWIQLGELQRRLYTAFLESAEVKDATAEGSAAAPPLVLLTMLMQICNHPWLCLEEAGFVEALRNPLLPLSDGIGDIYSGAKLPVAVALLEGKVAERRKSLVFSRSKRLLHMLAFLLKERGVSLARIDGDVSAEQRLEHVQAFNASPDTWVCLLTTQVGGVGLTFDSASCVVLLDPSWNPSADAQAIDRVHRIGQQHDVDVYRFVTCGTVEEKIYRNQVFKTMAAKQATMTPEEQAELFRYFTRTQLRSMFALGSLDTSETAAQLELLHPGRVAAEQREAARAIPCVADLSDNGCVLCEQVSVVEEEDQPDLEVLGGTPPPPPPPRRGRGRSGTPSQLSPSPSPSPPPAVRPRHETLALSDGKVAELLDGFEASETSPVPPPCSDAAKLDSSTPDE